MLKTYSIVAMMSLAILISLNPAHAELKLTRKTLAQKQASNLSKAEAKLETTLAKATCIKKAQTKRPKNATEASKMYAKHDFLDT